MSDPTRFDLDDRQRAMLAEMGVRVWWPQAPAALVQTEPAPAPSPVESTNAAPITAPTPVPVSAPSAPTVRASVATPAQRVQPVATPTSPTVACKPLPEGVSHMDWDSLHAAVKACQSCALSGARQMPVWGGAAAPADWMVVGDLPSPEDDQQGQPFTGPEGVLLDNMLKAVGVRRQGMPHTAQTTGVEAYLTCAVKCRPPAGRNPEASELAVCAAYLSRQVALAKPKVILAMGRFAIQSLLGSTEPMGKMRGTVHEFQGVPVVVTYHPTNLLRTPADKAKAWTDLVLALKVAQA
jgi:uracil-DNA glycosylase